MLNLTDLGCSKHGRRQLTLSGAEADLMKDVLYNLPRTGDFHTFICEHGNTHRINFHVLEGKWYPIAARFPEAWEPRQGQNKKGSL